MLAQAGIQVQLSVREIYQRCCKKCRIEIRKLIREKISDQMIDQVIGEEKTSKAQQTKP